MSSDGAGLPPFLGSVDPATGLTDAHWGVLAGLPLVDPARGPFPLQHRVVVYQAGHPAVIVDLTAEGLVSYANLRDALASELYHVPDMENKLVVDEHDEVKGNELALAYNVPPNGLAAKDTVLIKVEHANFEYSERYLHNSAKSTIGWLKAQLEPQRAHGEPFANLRLTWKGVPQTDETRLDSLEGVEAAAAAAAEGVGGGVALVGHKTLIIHDIDLGEQMQAELTKIQDHFTIKQVFELYQEQQRRFYLHEPIIARWNEAMAPENMGELTHDMLLEQLTTVWEAQLATNAVIALKTQSFKVIIKEQAELERLRQRQRTGVVASSAAGAADEVPGIEIDVFDFNRTRELKQQYSLAVTESLGPSDQIVLDTSDRAAGGGAAAAAAASAFDGELDDNDRLFKYGVRNGSVLLVKREDFTQPTSLYTCADCGSDVKLKQRDAVRCRECGHRIVFKKRIQKPCQYECR